MRNHTFRALLCAILGVLCMLAHAQYVPTTAGTDMTVADGAVTTATQQVSTSTLAWPEDGVVLHLDLDPGALSGITVRPGAAQSGNPDGDDYFRAEDQVTTFTTAGKYSLHWDRSALRASRYWAVISEGVGTDNSGSTCVVTMKRSMPRP